MSAENVNSKDVHTLPSLNAIFKPKNVAVIGASETEGSVGRTILWNLISSPFGGTIYPVNPKRANVLGIHAYKSILDIPVSIDLAVIVVPAKIVPMVMQECIDKGAKGAIIISAGFKETGEEGKALEQEILEMARGKIRIIGPNCLGVMMPRYGLNATFSAGMARPGNIAFVSQSGAICTAVLDWSYGESVGFSAFISVGSMLDVDWEDLIDYLGDDPHTSAIVIYMEAVGRNARGFLSAAREVALKKPIIVIKAGRTAAAAQAAASHTGALTGSDEVFHAALRRVGCLRVDRISDVFNMAEVLAKQPRPKGNKLTIVTNAGGPGVLATDALIEGGGNLTEISEETMGELNEILPFAWSHNNPIDILGDAQPELYAKTLEIAANDPNANGLLVILTPQDMTDPTKTAEALREYAHIKGKPVLASWMGGATVEGGEQVLNRAGIPTFEYPDTAARMFNYLWRYSHNLRALYETPILDDDDDLTPDRALVDTILAQVREEKRTILTEAESKAVLAAYHIPTVPMKIAQSSGEAVTIADEIGYPVVVKLNSETITHKMDVGGVELDLKDANAVQTAFNRIQQNVSELKGAEHFQGVSVQPMINLDDGYELIVGSSIDPQFGPVLLFGTGGSLVEVFKDRALGLPPLTSTLARRMMERTKIYHALQGVRGRDSVDMNQLEGLMVNFSKLVMEQPWIAELDINPLFASEDELIALDARIVLHPSDTLAEDLPQSAIRPYPSQYIDTWQSHQGSEYLIRPIRPEDEPAMIRFHETLSETTVQLRYFTPMSLSARTQHSRLVQICFIDYDRTMVLVAEDETKDENTVAGVVRLKKIPNTTTAEFGIIVSDPYQGQGIGTELLRRIIELGKAEGITLITAEALAYNEGMLALFRRLGFETKYEDGVISAALVTN